MVLSDAHEPGLSEESIYTIITGWAATANQRLLAGAVVLSGVLSTGLLAVDRYMWQFAAIAVAFGSICAWGLIEQSASRPHKRLVAAVESGLVGIGTFAALMGAVGMLFWLLGRSPIS